MPITSRFVADFSDFTRAVEQAEVTLKGLETESGRVENSLNRMVDQFSGRKLIQDANLMVEAVERIGGAAKLTDAELTRVSTKAAEASEKMKALGLAVPANLEKYAGALKTTTTETGKLGEATEKTGGIAALTQSAFGGLAAQMAGVFTVGAGLNLIKGAADLADEIQKVQAQTGLTADEVQRLQVIAGQTSVPFTALVTTAQNLQLALGRGDVGVTGALRELRINLDAFAKMNAYEQMREIARALGEIEDPTRRADLAQRALQRTWKEVLPAMTEEFGKVGDAAWAMSDESSKAFDGFVDDLGNMYRNAKVVLGETAGLFIRAKQSVLDFAQSKLPSWMENATSIQHSWEQFRNALQGGASDLKSTIESVPPAISTWGQAATAAAPSQLDLIDINFRLNQGLEESKRRHREAAEAAKQRAEAEAKAAKELAQWGEVFDKVTAKATPWQEVLATNDTQLNDWIQSLLRAGASVEDVAKAYGVSTGIVEANSRALKENAAAADAISRKYDDLASLTEEYSRLVEERTLTTTERQIAEITRWADHAKGKLMERNTDSEAMIDAIATERINKLMVNEDALQRARLDNLAERAVIERNTLQEMTDAELGTYTPAAIEAQRAKVAAAEQAAGEFSSLWSDAFAGTAAAAAGEAAGIAGVYIQAAQEVVTSWSQAMDLVRQGKGEMSGVLPPGGPGTMTNFGPWGSHEHKAHIARQYAAGRYFGPVKQRGPNPNYLPGMSYDVDWEALGMAQGGPVGAHQPYVVGERGPELFVPQTAGDILPHGSGGVTISNTFHVNGTGEDVARVVMNELTRMMRVGRKWPAV